jgi:hypothetical protein
MGLLDDAIREHLELMRRRGADATEISRQEREALGPARRVAEPAPAGSGADAASAEEWEDEPVAAGGPDPSPDEPARFAADRGPEPFVPDPEPFDREPEPAAPRAHDPAPTPAADPSSERLVYHHEPPVEREAAPPPPPPPPAEPARDGGFADEGPEIVPADDEPEADDILEETPEFLEETPEHDRLWFEQRPPRDFDFDG